MMAGEAIATMKADSFSSSKVASAALSRERVGVLLVNLGTPDTADTRGVRVYLREFLSDPRVIEKQGLLWKLILNCVILVIRPPRKARDYQKIWNTERNESPLKTITRAQAEKLGQSLRGLADRRRLGDALRQSVDPRTARTRWSRKAAIASWCVPLYPQYSAATTATVCDQVVARACRSMRAQPAVRFAPAYPIDADLYRCAGVVDRPAHLATLSFKPETIIASFHGMPQVVCRQGRSLLRAVRGDDRGAARRASASTTRR